jgi:hypothetical protein
VERRSEQRAGIYEDLAKIALSACNLDLRLRFVRVGYANKHYRIRRVVAKITSSNTYACSSGY